MNSKSLFVAMISLVLTACAVAPAKEPSDWSLQWGRQSARLRILDDEGKSVRAFDGNYLSIPGYVFVSNNISLHPGKKRISYRCSRPDDAIQVTHYVPSVEFAFEAGKQYELRCVDGLPVISLATEQEDYD